MKLRRHIFSYFVIAFSLSFTSLIHAEDTDYRANPELSRLKKDIKTLGMIPPDIKVYELAAGGMLELRDDWSAQAKENSAKAIADSLKEKNVDIKSLPLDRTELQEEMDDVQALYRTVALCINWHTYGMYPFPEKKKKFDYSVGPIEKILNAYGVDALIFVYARDEISTGGRKALNAAGIFVGIVTGAVYIPRSGITSMSVAVIDKSGTILWYNMQWSGGSYDLRDAGSASSFIQKILSNFPEVGK